MVRMVEMPLDIGLGVERRDGESWRDVVERYSAPHGLDRECLADFDHAVGQGEPENRACVQALGEWDCLDLYVDGKREGGRGA